MPDNAIANYNKQLEDKYKELESIINTDTKAERDYITKHPSQRDQYDIAFGKLNPESRAKADRFGSLVGEIQTINNNIVDLESAKHFFKNLYSQQRAETNSGFDNLQQSNALSNDIALSTALATAGGMGASGIQSAGLKAQANNLLAATQQKAEAERQDALAKITQAEAQVPLQLSNIGQINYQITKPETKTSGGYGTGGGKRPAYTPSGGNSKNDLDLIASKFGFTKNNDGTYNVNGMSVAGSELLKLVSDPEFLKNLDSVSKEEGVSGGKFLMKDANGNFQEVYLNPEQIKELQAKGMKIDKSQYGEVDGSFSLSDAGSRGLALSGTIGTALHALKMTPNPWAKAAGYGIPFLIGAVSEAVSPGKDKEELPYPVIGDGTEALRNEAAEYVKRKRKTK